MRSWLLALCVTCSVGAWAQSSAPNGSSPAGSSANAAPSNSPAPTAAQSGPRQSSPPRSDRVNADDLGEGDSSSKDEAVDLSAPANDEKAHPQSPDILMDAESAPGNGEVSEFHPWNPHKAAKDIEVGDYYFKARKNYRAAADRYREALLYKPNDAAATFRLAVCLEKMAQPAEALKEYENYLKILPSGPQSGEAHKATQRLQSVANAKPAQ